MVETFFFWVGVVATFFAMLYILMWLGCVCEGREWHSKKRKHS